MDNQQPATSSNIPKPQPPQNKGIEGLKPHHIRAIQLRLMGARHEIIATELNREKLEVLKLTKPDSTRYSPELQPIAEQTVRRWFMKGGLCYEKYQAEYEQRKLELDDLSSQMEEQIKAGAMDAIQMLRKKIVRGESETAARELLERYLGKVSQKVDHSGTIDSPQVADAITILSQSMQSILTPKPMVKPAPVVKPAVVVPPKPNGQ